MRSDEGMEITVCARRSFCQSTFGQGFNSPHLHHIPPPLKAAVFFIFLAFQAVKPFKKLSHQKDYLPLRQPIFR